MSAENWNLNRLLSVTSQFLKEKSCASARLDAELLLASVLSMSKVELYINFDRPISPEELSAYRELVRRRVKHEPVAYILGHKEFYNLRLKTTAAALIPRPETEHLVDEALRLGQALWPEEKIMAADLGTGTGAIALSLAKNLPAGAHLDAVDISPQALALAQENAANLNLSEKVSFFEGDLLSPLQGRSYHLICANLPYIPTPEMETLPPDVGLYEPHLALEGGKDGLSIIERLLAQGRDFLRPKGCILLEIWPDSWPQLLKIATNLGYGLHDEIIRDLAGHPRIVVLTPSI